MTDEESAQTPEPEEKIEKILSIARKIDKISEDGLAIMYSLEEEKFYIYDKGVYTKKHELEIMALLGKCWPRLYKLTLPQRRQAVDSIKTFKYKSISNMNWANLLNFQNGMLNPLDGIMIDHSPVYYSTNQIPYKFNENAEFPLWLKTLDEILEGDQGKITLLQEFFGYCLIPDVRMKKALLLLGESDSGKSTILFLLRWMLGEHNCSSVPLKFLSHPQYMPMLMNRLANIDADVSRNAQDYEAEFKIITSGEPITCNQKFVETYDFTPTCKIVLAANIFPKITDHSSAFYNRLLIIPCDRVFKRSEQDRELKNKLKNELAGILNWSIVGLKRLIQQGDFSHFNFMRDALEELEDENNPSNLFFKEFVIVEMGAEIEKGILFDRYQKWCLETKTYLLPKAKFANAINKKYANITPKDARNNDTGKRVWRNIRLIELHEQQLDRGWEQ